jgi:hypothetical protein
MRSLPFRNLNIKRQYRYKLKERIGVKINTGLDTETYKGFCKLICRDDGEYKEVTDIFDALKFLSNPYFNGKLNWFYNIKFDFESIIKYLPDKELYDLYHDHHINYYAYRISYLNGKFLSIRLKNTSNTFYDMFNFLEISLNNAAKKYLHQEKKEGIDAPKLNTSKEYWRKNHDLIITYCRHDALLTKQLADYFWSIFYQKLSYAPSRPFSKGKLSEEYFLSRCYIPTINDIPKIALEYAYKNYSGGRFELLKRGFFPEAYSYDIKSAYPYQMTQLYDYSLGEWTKVNTMDKNCDIGFYHCKVESLEPYFSPFLIKVGMLSLYPNGKFYQYLNSDEIKFIRKNFPHIKITILSGVECILFKERQPFKSEIERLYKWKESEKDEDIKYCVKIVLNALYGKTWQKVNNNTGRLFNPIWASLITSRTRLKILEMALKSPENIIDMLTDSISSTSLINTPKNPKMGDFSLDFTGKSVNIMCGVYTLWNDKKVKRRNRSFTVSKKIFKDSFNLMMEMDTDKEDKFLLYMLESLKRSTKYKYVRTRPYHLGECLIQTKKKNPSMINIWYKEKKDININGDKKREWIRPFKNGLDALKNNINSYPLKF